MTAIKNLRCNEQIRLSPIRVIDENGGMLGVIPTDEALRRARDLGLDLVEVSPTERPPVCKIMDYGKYKYHEQKKQHEAKLKQKQIQVKEVKLRPRTDENDYQIKLRNLRRFLEEGDKAKVTLRFRGRELSHQELGMRQLERIREDLADIGVVEQMPRLEGRQMVMVIAPKKSK